MSGISNHPPGFLDHFIELASELRWGIFAELTSRDLFALSLVSRNLASDVASFAEHRVKSLHLKVHPFSEPLSELSKIRCLQILNDIEILDFVRTLNDPHIGVPDSISLQDIARLPLNELHQRAQSALIFLQSDDKWQDKPSSRMSMGLVLHLLDRGAKAQTYFEAPPEVLALLGARLDRTWRVGPDAPIDDRHRVLCAFGTVSCGNLEGLQSLVSAEHPRCTQLAGHAAGLGHCRILDYLYSSQPSFYALNKGLREAIKADNPETIRYFMMRGLDPWEMRTELLGIPQERTPYQDACLRGSYKTLAIFDSIAAFAAHSVWTFGVHSSK